MQNENSTHKIVSRQAVAGMEWGNTIPYAIENLEADGHRAVANIMSVTCLKFVQRTTETNYIAFVKKNGCFSPVGNNGGRQEISITGGCDVS